MATTPKPPMATAPKPYMLNDPTSFAYDTVERRLPAIITQIVDDFERATQNPNVTQEALNEAPSILSQFDAILADLKNNAEIKPLAGAGEINNYIQPGMRHRDAAWLPWECHLYRQLHSIFANSQHWRSYDLFGHVKMDTFLKSSVSVGTLAAKYVQVSQEAKAALQKDRAVAYEGLKLLFHQMLMTAVWGNATDLSLLVTISLEEIERLQIAVEDREAKALLANDFDAVWKQVHAQPGGRVDIVLDNSGFELFTDLILALFLLESGLAEQVVMHPKTIPWFVSDVTPADWASTLGALRDPKLFASNREAIDAVLERLHGFLEAGQVLLRPSPFWTQSTVFWEIRENGADGGDAVWRDLRASKLVIFKGDLNYRKLTGDLGWPRTTAFKEALQGAATNGIPVVSLRTVKSDVAVGLAPGREEELEKEWEQQGNKYGWAWSGQFAVLSFNGR